MESDQGYSIEILIQGFPGKTDHHGSLGWNSVSLLRGHGQVLIIDTGDYMYREALRQQLRQRGLEPSDITGVLITHCHSDHMCNYPMFPNATVYISEADLEWAVDQPVATSFIPEFHVRDLRTRQHVTLLTDDQEILPGLRSVATPGHTPGHMAYVVASGDADWIFTGDALKNEAELTSGEAAMTLDARESKRSIARLRSMAMESAANVIVPGHDRLLSLDSGRIVTRAPLIANVRRTLPSGERTTIDLTRS